jgi:hypothetical protein
VRGGRAAKRPTRGRAARAGKYLQERRGRSLAGPRQVQRGIIDHINRISATRMMAVPSPISNNPTSAMAHPVGINSLRSHSTVGKVLIDALGRRGLAALQCWWPLAVVFRRGRISPLQFSVPIGDWRTGELEKYLRPWSDCFLQLSPVRLQLLESDLLVGEDRVVGSCPGFRGGRAGDDELALPTCLVHTGLDL